MKQLVRSSSNKIWFLRAAIIFLTLLVFLPSLRNQFTNWDDPQYLLENPLVQNLSVQNIYQIFTTHLNGRYHPLTLLFLSLQFYFFKFQPFGYHLVSLLLHVMNVSLVFLFVTRLTQRNVIGLIAALIFAIHPMQVESVAWVSSQKDLWCGMFSLLALLSYLKSNGNPLTKKTYLFFILALFSKATAIVLPVLFVLIDAYKSRLTIATILQKSKLGLISLAWVLITTWAVHQFDSFPATTLYTPFERLWLSGYANIRYIQTIFLPFDLTCFNPRPLVLPNNLFPWEVYACSFLSVLLAVSAVLFFKRLPLASFAYLFFLTWLLPVLHFIKVNDTIIYDRFVYIGLIGAVLMVSSVVDTWGEKVSRGIQLFVWICAGVYLAGLIITTVTRIPVWHDSKTLWSDAIKKNPTHPLAYFNRGSHYFEVNQFEKSIRDSSQAINLDPNFVDAYYNRALAYEKVAEHQKAIDDLSHVLLQDPQRIDAAYHRAVNYLIIGQRQKADEDVEYVLKNYPSHPEALQLRKTLAEIQN